MRADGKIFFIFAYCRGLSSAADRIFPAFPLNFKRQRDKLTGRNGVFGRIVKIVKFFRRLKLVAVYGDASRKQKPLTAAFDNLSRQPEKQMRQP
jgi:hypothetical protein